jgi:hypothetical protein
MAILREVWKMLSQLTDPHAYIKVAEVFIELPAKNFTVRRLSRPEQPALPLARAAWVVPPLGMGLSCVGRCQYVEVDALLGDLVKHLTPDRAYEKLQTQLQSIVEKILIHMTNFDQVFMMVRGRQQRTEIGMLGERKRVA